ncbi:MAG TPA: hypothetical protein VNM48_20980 [Chloroflexota bacterium]|nr:hypothetical protein [Chloroflexota bacterium]
MEPLAFDDAAQGYALLYYCEAIGRTLEQVDGYVRDRPDLKLPGWGILLDVDNAPVEALGWLSGFVGVTLLAGETTAQSRARIRGTDGFARGSVGAVKGAAALYLTGTKTAILRERYNATNPNVDSPYHMQVITYTSETPNSAAVLSALLAQKPAGIVLTHQVNAGQDLQSVSNNHATLQSVSDAFATLQMLADAKTTT